MRPAKSKTVFLVVYLDEGLHSGGKLKLVEGTIRVEIATKFPGSQLVDHQ